MTDVAIIRREVDALEQIQRDLAAISSRQDGDRRRDLIVSRRRLAEQITRVGAVAEMHFRDDPVACRDYRALFSAMRSAAALHQANWPAVMLGEREEDYSASASDVRRANAEFVAWMRRMLARP